MPRSLAPVAAILLVFLFGALQGGCSPVVDPCTEFDPPPGHKPSSCPPKPAEPAAASRPAQPARYCYSTLAQPDCFTEPQPGRTGYLGTTAPPPAPPRPAPAAPAPAAPAPAGSKSAPAQPVDAAPATPTPSTPVPPAPGTPTPLSPAT